MVSTYVGDSASGAILDESRTYRYTLWRRWDRDAGLAVFIGLNPSTADENADDPTIRRCIGFAKSWQLGGVLMVNLFAFRARWPKDMQAAPDPIGPQNDAVLGAIGNGEVPSNHVVCCWGNHGSYRNRDKEVLSLLRRPKCFGKTASGQPKHPLYLPKASTLEPM